MARSCSFCLTDNPAAARYCGQCGRELPGRAGGGGGSGEPAGPLVCPVGFTPCLNSNEVYYRWQAVGAGSFFGCEYLGVILVNGGQTLVEVELKLTGRGADQQPRFELQRKLYRIERGQSVSLEIARHELPEVPEHLDVTLVSAKQPPDEEAGERRPSCQRPWWASSWWESS